MAKRWTIPFKSLSNKDCRIDIYDPAWSGSVTELSVNNANAPGVAAPDPFYYEEDDDENLLKVVRIKTGYINLIETVQNGLVDLYPTSLKSRYVQVSYDGYLMFRGYIQQQSFENEWKASPREVSLPVVSVLGIAESLDLDAEMGIYDKKIGYYMKELLRKIEPTDTSNGVSKYLWVTFPENSRSNFAGDFAATIRPLVTTKDNPDFSKVMGTEKAPYAGISLYDFLEGICNAYGWIVHDTATRVLFTKFDNDRNYSSYPVNYNSTADIETATGKTSEGAETVLDLGNIMEPSSDDGTITQIMPLRSITVSPDGELVSSVNLEFKHMRCTQLYEWTHNSEKYPIAILDNADANAKDILSSYLRPRPEINSSGVFTQDGVIACDMKNQKRIMVQNVNNWQSVGNMFYLLFYNRPIYKPSQQVSSNLKMEVDISWANSIFDLGHSSRMYFDPIRIQFTLNCAGTEIGTKTLEFNDDGDHKQTVEFENVTIPYTGALWLKVKALNPSEWTLANIVSFDSIRLFYEEDVTAEYLVDNSNTKFVSYEGVEEAEIKMLMSCQYLTNHMIGTTDLHALFFTNYNYLRNTQHRLQLSMRPKSANSWPDFEAYMKKIQFWRTNWRWRLIAQSFHPWDDEWTLTLHRSSTLE